MLNTINKFKQWIPLGIVLLITSFIWFPIIITLLVPITAAIILMGPLVVIAAFLNWCFDEPKI